MTIQEAITSAVNGGYKYQAGTTLAYDNSYDEWFVNDGDGGFTVPSLSDFWIDPRFWQALGASVGWVGTSVFKNCLCLDNKNPKQIRMMEWHLYWHKFIDHLIEGGTPESFFATL